MQKVTSSRKQHHLQIGDKVYTFQLTFMTWLRLEERYKKNAAVIVDDFIIGKDRITNLARILACSCTEEVSATDIASNIDFNVQNTTKAVEIVLQILGSNAMSGDVEKK